MRPRENAVLYISYIHELLSMNLNCRAHNRDAQAPRQSTDLPSGKTQYNRDNAHNQGSAQRGSEN